MNRPHRSWLYVPAIRPELVEKALAGAADAVILDLEDSVPAQRKDEARAVAVSVLDEHPTMPVYVRINDPEGPWARADVDAIAAHQALAGIRLPKCESPERVRTVASWLEAAGSGARLHCLLESALGLERAFDIACASPRVASVGLGEADLRASLRVRADHALICARSRVVTAARAAGLPSPVQSVYPRLRDPEGLLRTSRTGRDAGFFGRSVIHPEQIEVIHDVYTPDEDDVSAARELIASLDEALQSGSSAFLTHDGRFVDPAVVESARWTLALVETEEGSP